MATPQIAISVEGESLLELQVAAINATANAVVITNRSGIIVWANPAFERVTGYAPAAVIGQSTRILKSGENDPGLYKDLWLTILAGKVWRGDLVNCRPDGSLYHEEMTISPLRNAKGEITHFVGVKQDITERKRIQRHLDVLSRVVESTSELIAIGDAGLHITFANPALLKSLGYSAEELLGRSFYSIVSPNSLPRLREEATPQTLAGGWSGECVQLGRDGAEIPVLLSTGVLRDEQDAVCGVFGIARDITEQKRAQKEMLIKNALLEAQAEATIDGILAVGEDDRIILSNERFQTMWGIPKALMTAGDDVPLLKYVLAQIENPQQFLHKVQYLYEHRQEKSKDEIRLKDGRVFERYSSPLLDRSEISHGRIWYFRDITERLETQHNLQLWSQVLHQSAEGIFVCDAQQKILLANSAFEKLTGYSANEVIGKNPRILQSGRQSPAFYAEMWKTLLETHSWRGEIWNRRKNGELFAEWLSVSAVCDGAGTPTHYVGIFSDITSRKQDQERIQHLAHYDVLTDLPNRALLLDRLIQLTKTAARRGSKLAVIFLDLDRFKEVNDSLGHNAGDLLLREVVKRISNAMRSQDTVARMGGDEFVVVIQDLADERVLATIANQLLACLVEPIDIDGHRLTVTASLGLSVYPDDAANEQELIRNADAAMYQAKNLGRNGFHFYTSDMNRRALEMLSTESGLRRALERQEFVLHYQPQVSIPDGGLIGAEALIRWNHPDLGLVMPGDFISIAEDRGLIVPIGTWVIEEACRQLRLWNDRGFPLPIAVNVSAVQFRQKDFFEVLTHSVGSHGLSPQSIDLELTESIVMRDAETTVDLLRKLHDFGFKLSLDDFGTGYSSLSYLRRFPFDKIKIDKSFLADESGECIVRVITGLAHSLGRECIAEGVQTPQQVALLHRHGCEQAQGFLFGRPIPAKEFEQRFKAQFARWSKESQTTPIP